MRDSKARLFRLAWEQRGEESRSTTKARTLAAGEYTLVGFRIVDRSRAGEVWHISGSGTKLRTIQVPATGALRLEVAAGLSVKQRFDGSSAGMEIRGADQSGVSIYKNGARIRVRYRVLGAKGEVLASGKMNYG
ncbi:MAG TPA: hypothetical protein VK843_11350 [Planctomycetota bacterium]|nr:hypothetical protein [Planctomycetota bacterium]